MRIGLTWLCVTGPLLALSGACAEGLRSGGDGSGGDAGETGSGGADASGGKGSSSGGRTGASVGGSSSDGGTAGESSGGRPTSGGSDGSGGSTSGCAEIECPKNASCVSDDGEVSCLCDDGFEEDEDGCVDIDECGEENECSRDASCENSEGDYECTCGDGFVGDGRICTPRTRLVSVGTTGAPGNSSAQSPALSADGLVVAFHASSSDLVSNDSNGEDDIFVFERTTGLVERVSVGSAGGQTNSFNYGASLSGDGRYVAFASYANNLVPNDTNGATDVFRHDRTNRTTIRVSVLQDGGEAIGAAGFSAFPTISNDGNRIAFTSAATNLVPGDTNDYLDQFVRDVAESTTTRVSVSSSGAQVTGITQSINTSPQISGNGRYVAFVSLSSQLGSNVDIYEDIFLRDLVDNVTWEMSYSGPGLANDDDATNPSPSADGRFIVFQSASSGLLPGDTNNFNDVFIRDLNTGAIERVSVGDDEVQANAQSYLAYQRSVSNDGRFVVFSSLASNLVADDTNGLNDVFVRDRLNGTTTRVSVGPRGEEADAPSSDATISADGRIVAFQSASRTFGADTQGRLQVWIRDLNP